MRRRAVGVRVICGWLFVVVAVFRFMPRIILPSTMRWSGDWWSSKYGLAILAYQDVLNIVLGTAALGFLLSFTTLFDRARDPAA